MQQERQRTKTADSKEGVTAVLTDESMFEQYFNLRKDDDERLGWVLSVNNTTSSWEAALDAQLQFTDRTPRHLVGVTKENGMFEAIEPDTNQEVIKQLLSAREWSPYGLIGQKSVFV